MIIWIRCSVRENHTLNVQTVSASLKFCLKFVHHFPTITLSPYFRSESWQSEENIFLNFCLRGLIISWHIRHYGHWEHEWTSLFVWGFKSHSRIFHSYWDVKYYWWRASNFDLYWHSWPLSSEGSLACHTYCDMGILL